MNKKEHECKYLFLLSGENILISAEEAATVLDVEKYKLKKNLLIAELSKDSVKKAKKLAYTHAAYKLLFTTENDKIIEAVKKYPWNKEYKENFCIRINKLTGIENEVSAKELAGIVWNQLEQHGIKPKVNLEQSKTPVYFIVSDEKTYCGLLIRENKGKFEQRKAQFRPGFSPISMHPKLARAMVNLTGAETKDTIVDPFCGTGGILIESAFAGIKSKGSDLSKEMLDKCRQNIEFYKITSKQCKIEKKDALKLKEKIKYLATDVPYGRSSGQKNKKELEELYFGFLKMLKKNLAANGKAVVAFPDDVNYKKAIRKAKLKIQKEFSYYVHKSMTKKIVVMEK